MGKHSSRQDPSQDLGVQMQKLATLVGFRDSVTHGESRGLLELCIERAGFAQKVHAAVDEAKKEITDICLESIGMSLPSEFATDGWSSFLQADEIYVLSVVSSACAAFADWSKLDQILAYHGITKFEAESLAKKLRETTGCRVLDLDQQLPKSLA